MRVVLQRVEYAKCTVDNKVTGEIKKGYLLLVGYTNGDNETQNKKAAKKIANLRIFEDENGKMNLSLREVNGEVLSISQFTLYANCKKGNRPSFIESGAPDMAEEMYKYIIAKCKESVPVVEKGSFGADMKVSLINDGPFTVLLDSEQL